MKMKKISLSALISAALGLSITAQVFAESENSTAIPKGMASGQVDWQVVENKSDNFESEKLNDTIWENAPKSLNVGAWTFTQKNTFVEGGKLNIAATQETHTRKFQDSCWDGKAGGPAKTTDRTLYYKSGAVRTRAEGVYGFYEASMKGVKLFPGLSPAFWLYSDNHPYADRNDKSKQYVDYSEIDIVELQQADWRSPTDVDGINVMDHNLHARVEEKGKIVWKRPKPNRETQLLHYKAPFDPSLDFHTYAVENRPDRIFWYVDGKLIGSKANTWWHRPMHMIFSMGLRRQFIRYNGACQRADPHPDNVTKKGFPEDATMQVDYVKTWQAAPSIWLSNVDALTKEPHSGDKLTVNVGYHGGSNFYLVSGKSNGLTVRLTENNDSGFVKEVAKVTDASSLELDKRYGGEIALSLDLSGVTSSSNLKKGHYYTLSASFDSSNGKVIKTKSLKSALFIMK